MRAGIALLWPSVVKRRWPQGERRTLRGTSTAAKGLWRVESVTFAMLFLWLMAIGPGSLFRDPGTFWHIRVGERILDAGATIRTDPFSATFAGQPWVPVGWFAECVMAVLHRLGGLDTILLATATALAAFYAWIARRMAARGLQAPVVALLLALSIASSSYHFLPRPHLASMILLGWMFARLADFEGGRLPIGRLLWFVPAVIAWTNLHGGVVGGLATFALCGAGWTVAALVGAASPISRLSDFVKLASLGLVCLAAVLVNPYGFELPKLWFTLLDSPVLPQLMVEHAPLSLSDSSGRLVASLGLLYAAALVGVPLRSIRVTWLIPIVWFVLTCSRIRNGPLFAITATLALAEMYADIRWVHWLTRHGSELLRLRGAKESTAYERSSRAAVVLPALLVGTVLVLQLARVPLPVIGHGWTKLDAAYWPVELLPDLHAYEREHPGGAAIFNEMLFGGFLIYFTPGLHAFIDDRCELHGDARLSEYRRAINGELEIFESWERQYGFEIALSATGSQFERYLKESPRWELVRESKPAALYRRRPAT